MKKLAQYIKKIEISSLWSGHKHIVWELRPEVNVLSGGNGAGKSTIINRLVQHLRSIPTNGEIRESAQLGVRIDFEPSDATIIHYDIIRSFDRNLLSSEKLGQIADGRIITDLDWQLYLLQRRYLDYQVNVANRMIEMLSDQSAEVREKAAEAAEAKTHFQDLVDDLFSETGKRIDRRSNELSFIQYDETLPPYLLSSGEKQMLIILLTALTEDRQPYVI